MHDLPDRTLVDMRRVNWESIVTSDAAYHVARHTRFPAVAQLHTHDFAEVFWVDDGRATHDVNSHRYRVSQGDLVLVRPSDRHGFRFPADQFTITNIAFRAEVITDLRNRYFLGGGLPWEEDDPSLRSMRLTPLQLGSLQDLGAAMANGPTSRLHLDRLLVEILLGFERPVSGGSELPMWLQHALSAWRTDPVAMAAGVGGLATIACRSREHVSRVLKQKTGRRAIDVLNDLRLDSAAAALAMTDQPIALIAVEVGLANLSHFYRLFGRRFGTTPRRYRLRKHALIHPETEE
ncbi:MAG: helix-turn-helix domain-containing protein [Acidimicrobiia bacterium]|nr:helix-turn-helix domain-containing protein [Acidimicrobiia bacterium]